MSRTSQLACDFQIRTFQLIVRVVLFRIQLTEGWRLEKFDLGGLRGDGSFCSFGFDRLVCFDSTLYDEMIVARQICNSQLVGVLH